MYHKNKSANRSIVQVFLPILFFLSYVSASMAQSGKVIRLYPGKAPGSENWKQQEKIYHDAASGEQFVYNVTDPTITVFTPDSAIATGTAIIVCPGGAFHVLGIDNEGYHVAKWLNSIGITAFVLKYRLAETKTDEPLKELGSKMQDFQILDAENTPVVPLAVADAEKAIQYVRAHASEWKVRTDRIGLMGFSAGGTVTSGVAFNYTAGSRPDFVAPVYAYLKAVPHDHVPADAPPMFIAAATDDDLGFAPQSIQLYTTWMGAKKRVELHLFAKGGHGFGMKKRKLPVDNWTNLFVAWIKNEGFL